MITRVSLAGVALAWRFRETARLEEWLLARPWAASGGVLALEVGDAKLASWWGLQLEAGIRAADEGLSHARIRHVHHWEEDATSSVAAWLGVPGTSRFLLRQALANELTTAPSIFIVERAPPRAGLLSELEELAGLLPKLEGQARLCVLALSSGTEPSAGGIDLSRGAPAESVLVGDADGQLFARYAHLRIAWETGGDLGLAQAASEQLGRLRDDDRLEFGLNAFASRPLTRQEQERLDELEERLDGDGLSKADDLVPWMARRLLLAGRLPRAQALLRQTLVCLPLAREIIAGCFELEGRVRHALFHRLDGPPPPKAIESWREFQNGGLRNTARLYPRGCPATPAGPWSFASFGEVLTGAGVSGNAPEHRLRHLRNAMAHGHYASWRCVEELVALRRAFR